MIRLLTLSAVLYCQIVLSNCLETPKGIGSSKYLYVTASGETYFQAKSKLVEKIPQVGLLQSVQMRSTKTKGLESYNERISIRSNLQANFDYAIFNECKHQGEFYISATIPKKNVTYIPRYPLIIPDNVKSYSYLNKICGLNRKVFIIISGPMAAWESIEELHAKRISVQGFSLDVLCGNVQLEVERCSRHNGCWSKKSFNNKFDKLRVLYIPTRFMQNPVQDHTDMWRLELAKEFILK